MAGTLIIGVGGTGLKTLIHVKKQLQDARATGDLPPSVQILGIDTRDTPEKISGIGSYQSALARRQMKEYRGDVMIDPNTEYFWLGGNVYQDVCGDPTQGLRGWGNDHFASRRIDLKYYQNSSKRKDLLNIRAGAGMYRQIGLLALFANLQHGRTSLFYQTLSRKLQAFADLDVNVILCGSLAGGTGASLFLDIAHLLRQIAPTVNKSVDITAMLVLPDAFQWTPGLEVDASMRARGMASMREMVRFLTVHDNALGFRLQYTNDENDQILNSRTQGALFSLVYLMEQRAKLPQKNSIPNPLTTKIEYGVTPTMATWIVSLCDQSIAQEFVAWKANLAAIAGARNFQGLVPAFCGSFGTFSMVLPVASIVEKWTTRLSNTILSQMVPVDSEGRFDPTKVGGFDVPAGSSYVREDWHKNPAVIARDAGDLGDRYSETTVISLIKEIRDRQVDSWRRVFLDEAPSEEQIKTFEKMDEKKTYFYIPLAAN